MFKLIVGRWLEIDRKPGSYLYLRVGQRDWCFTPPEV